MGLARLTVGEWSAPLARRPDAPEAADGGALRRLLREHIEPWWGRVRLGDVSRADVHSRVARLAVDRSTATVRKVHRVLSPAMALAVKDGRLARNAVAGVSLPRITKGSGSI